MSGPAEPGATAATGGTFVTFLIAGELHGFPVAAVVEVVEDPEIHPLPRAGGELLGILRFRGELVPVFDIAPLLGQALQSEGSRVVLVIHAGSRTVGIAADDADEVLTLGRLHAPPAGGGELEHALRGIGRSRGRLVTVLEPSAVVPDQWKHVTQGDQ